MFTCTNIHAPPPTTRTTRNHVLVPPSQVLTVSVVVTAAGRQERNGIARTAGTAAAICMKLKEEQTPIE